MISGELDILKDWCYEAVSARWLFFFSCLGLRRNNNLKEICWVAPSRKSSMARGVSGVGVAAGWGSRGQGSGWKGTLENPWVH